jgi:phosphohistidine phosphatase SixA
MKSAMFRAVLATALSLASAATLAQPASEPDLVKALKDGGLVVVVRHGATHNDQADTDPLNVDKPGNEAKQRQLNDKGREAARSWREGITKMGIPVGKVWSSQFHRARETARLGFGEPEPSFDFTEGGQVVTPMENNRRAAALKKAAATVPAPGTNTFIVTHKPNVMDAFGKDWFEVKEGEASVFRPDGNGGYVLVGRIVSDQWGGLAAKYPK